MRAHVQYIVELTLWLTSIAKCATIFYLFVEKIRCKIKKNKSTYERAEKNGRMWKNEQCTVQLDIYMTISPSLY